jgi:hypothetical protein
MFCVSHTSLAQNYDSEVANLPFGSYLTKTNDTLRIIEHEDPLVFWEKIDSTKNWKLIGLKVSDSTSHATEEFFPWTSKSISFRGKGTLPTFNSDSVNNQFNRDTIDIRKLSNWDEYELPIDWTHFRYKSFLIIKKCNRFIGLPIIRWTTFEYYFEEIK